jgi:hypothetical protein
MYDKYFRAIPHGMWVAGFASGDGYFYTKLTNIKIHFIQDVFLK